MNPSGAPAHSGEVEGRYMNGALGESDPEAVEQLIARVLRRAHRTAETFEAPNDARVILHVAHSSANRALLLYHAGQAVPLTDGWWVGERWLQSRSTRICLSSRRSAL